MEMENKQKRFFKIAKIITVLYICFIGCINCSKRKNPEDNETNTTNKRTKLVDTKTTEESSDSDNNSKSMLLAEQVLHHYRHRSDNSKFNILRADYDKHMRLIKLELLGCKLEILKKKILNGDVNDNKHLCEMKDELNEIEFALNEDGNNTTTIGEKRSKICFDVLHGKKYMEKNCLMAQTLYEKNEIFDLTKRKIMLDKLKTLVSMGNFECNDILIIKIYNGIELIDSNFNKIKQIKNHINRIKPNKIKYFKTFHNGSSSAQEIQINTVVNMKNLKPTIPVVGLSVINTYTLSKIFSYLSDIQTGEDTKSMIVKKEKISKLINFIFEEFACSKSTLCIFVDKKNFIRAIMPEKGYFIRYYRKTQYMVPENLRNTKFIIINSLKMTTHRNFLISRQDHIMSPFSILILDKDMKKPITSFFFEGVIEKNDIIIDYPKNIYKISNTIFDLIFTNSTCKTYKNGYSTYFSQMSKFPNNKTDCKIMNFKFKIRNKIQPIILYNFEYTNSIIQIKDKKYRQLYFFEISNKSDIDATNFKDIGKIFYEIDEKNRVNRNFIFDENNMSQKLLNVLYSINKLVNHNRKKFIIYDYPKKNILDQILFSSFSYDNAFCMKDLSLVNLNESLLSFFHDLENNKALNLKKIYSADNTRYKNSKWLYNPQAISEMTNIVHLNHHLKDFNLKKFNYKKIKHNSLSPFNMYHDLIFKLNCSCEYKYLVILGIKIKHKMKTDAKSMELSNHLLTKKYVDQRSFYYTNNHSAKNKFKISQFGISNIFIEIFKLKKSNFKDLNDLHDSFGNEIFNIFEKLNDIIFADKDNIIKEYILSGLESIKFKTIIENLANKLIIFIQNIVIKDKNDKLEQQKNNNMIITKHCNAAMESVKIDKISYELATIGLTIFLSMKTDIMRSYISSTIISQRIFACEHEKILSNILKKSFNDNMLATI